MCIFNEVAHNFEMNTADFCSEELLNNRTFDEKFDSKGQARWGIKGAPEKKLKNPLLNPPTMHMKRGKIW